MNRLPALIEKSLATHKSHLVSACALSDPGEPASGGVSTRVVELVTLVLVSAAVFYFFPFPFSLLCFIVAIAISTLWFLLLSGERGGLQFEIHSHSLQYLLPPSSVIILVLARLARVGGRFLVPLAAAVTFLVPGFTISYLLEGRKGRPSISLIGMACALSVVFNGLVYSLLALTPLSSGSYAGVFLGLDLALASVPALKESISSHLSTGESHSVRFDELVVLSTYTVIVAFAILVLYPTNALIPSYDITAHFTSARVASLSPTSLRSLYPFFQFDQAITILISRPPAGQTLLLAYNPVFQATFALMGALVLMCAFYSLAKSQLTGFGSQVPLVATGIFMFFGGLAWTQAQNQAFGPSFSVDFLSQLFDASYWDVRAGPGQFLWFWFRPITLGILFLILLLLLLTRPHGSRRRGMAITVLLVTGLYFVHIPDLLIFVAVLLVMAVMKPASMPGLEQVAAGLALSCPFVAVIALEQLRLGIFQVGYGVLGAFIAGSVVAYLVARFVPRLHLQIGSRAVRIVGLFSLAGYGVLVALWLLWPSSFSAVWVSALMIVPTKFYPVLLGIGVALALLAFVFYDELRTTPLVASVYLLVLFFIIGRSISLVNYAVFYTSYWERRLIPILWIPLSILAAFALVKTVSAVRSMPILRGRSSPIGKSRSSTFLTAATLGLVVLLGASSLFVGVWYGRVEGSADQLTQYQLPMASYLASGVTLDHPIFPSASETDLEAYAPTVYAAGPGSLLNFQESYPERPLISMVDTGYGTPYVLANTVDLANPSLTASGYLADLLQILPATYASGTARLYSLGNISAPSPSSSTCIGVSSPPGSGELFAFDLLSSVRANYTSLPNSDASLGRCNSIFLGAGVKESLAQQLLSGPGNYSITVVGEASDFFFSKMFLGAKQTQEFNASLLTGEGGTYLLPSILSVRNVSVSAGVTSTSFYSSSSGETVPLSLQKSYGNHTVTFLNLQPFIDALYSLVNTRLAVFSFFQLIVKAAQIGFEPAQTLSTNLRSFTIAFANARLTGGVSFETSDLVLAATPLTATVTTTSGNRSVSGATGLSLYSPTGAMTVSTKSAILSGGDGFYAKATFTKPLVVSGANLEATLSFGNGTIVTLQSVVHVRVLGSGSPKILLRTPKVTDDSGSVTLQELTVLNAPTFSRLVTSLQATLTGGVSFVVGIGDLVSFATGLHYGSVTYSPSLVQWDESALFYDVAPVLGVLAVVLAWRYYLRRRRKPVAVSPSVVADPVDFTSSGLRVLPR